MINELLDQVSSKALLSYKFTESNQTGCRLLARRDNAL